MNAKRRKLVNVPNAAARIPGAAMNAHVVGNFSISGTMIPA